MMKPASSRPVIDTPPRNVATALFSSSESPVRWVSSMAPQDSAVANSNDVNVPSSAALVRRLTPCAR